MDLAQGITIVGACAVALLTLIAFIKLRRRRRAGGFGPGIIGAYDGFQTQDRRQAMELIVEERAAEKRPEYPDGNLPELEKPDRHG